MAERRTTWRQLVQEAVAGLPATFSLADLTGKRDFFAAHYPDNNFIDPKIRQSLQLLRDQGVLEFLGGGRYRRIDTQPAFSPLIDPATANAYTNRTQMARVMLETWAEFNLYCLNCTAESLARLPANTPVADFQCASCGTAYQLKSKDGRFGTTIAGAAYRPLLEAARSQMMPEHVLVEFDTRFSTVVFVDAIPGAMITEDRILARKPLSPQARRHGWQGCSINIAGLPSARLVQPAGIDRVDVRSKWRSIAKR